MSLATSVPVDQAVEIDEYGIPVADKKAAAATIGEKPPAKIAHPAA